jgi:hypothetical protein
MEVLCEGGASGPIHLALQVMWLRPDEFPRSLETKVGILGGGRWRWERWDGWKNFKRASCVMHPKSEKARFVGGGYGGRSEDRRLQKCGSAAVE